MAVDMEPDIPGEDMQQSEEVEDSATYGEGVSPAVASCGDDGGDGGSSRWSSAKKWLKKHWPHVLAGIGVGAGIGALAAALGRAEREQEPGRQAEQIGDGSGYDYGMDESSDIFDDAPEKDQGHEPSPRRKSPTRHSVEGYQRHQHWGPGNEYEKIVDISTYMRGNR
ncbi:MAG: hypothetical protein Q3999_06995 [Buchananella hordeovulneris]|nr:hypothetical protein [Buchananella hordeovulneris]